MLASVKTAVDFASSSNISLLNASTDVTLFDYNASEFSTSSSIETFDGDNESRFFHPCDPQNFVFNCSIDDYLSFHLGAKQMPLETAIWVSITDKDDEYSIYIKMKYKLLSVY